MCDAGRRPARQDPWDRSTEVPGSGKTPSSRHARAEEGRVEGTVAGKGPLQRTPGRAGAGAEGTSKEAPGPVLA